MAAQDDLSVTILQVYQLPGYIVYQMSEGTTSCLASGPFTAVLTHSTAVMAHCTYGYFHLI